MAKVFELLKSENSNEELFPCFFMWFLLTDGEKKEVAKDFVREGGLEEIFKRSQEEMKTLEEKAAKALDFYQERRARLFEMVFCNPEEAQKKRIVLKAN